MIGMPDVTATILDAAGAAPGLVQDGVPLTDAIGGVSPHDRPVPIRASVDIASRQRFRGVRTARWAYWRLTASGEEELYDLRADPWQLDNLAGRPALADIQRQLVALTDVVQTCRGDGCRIPTPAALR
jgi:arylsulfatase A-like enzyme